MATEILKHIEYIKAIIREFKNRHEKYRKDNPLEFMTLKTKYNLSFFQNSDQDYCVCYRKPDATSIERTIRFTMNFISSSNTKPYLCLRIQKFNWGFDEDKCSFRFPSNRWLDLTSTMAIILHEIPIMKNLFDIQYCYDDCSWKINNLDVSKIRKELNYKCL